MIDLFEDVKPQPAIYIADVTVAFNFKPRKNSKKVERHSVTLEKIPIVLTDGKFPTKKKEASFMKRVFDKHGKGSFENSAIRLVKLENCKFSSWLAYDFDYNVH